jgi:ribosomal protein S27E
VLKDKISKYGISTEHFGPYNTIYKNQDKLIETVKSSISLNEVLKKMGFRPAGGNYASLRKWIKELKLDTSHFKGKSHGKSSRKIPLEKILVEYSNYGSNELKKRLIKEEILKNECVKCGQGPMWKGEELTLQLDHINGEHTDNRIENLRILCPNCHTQTTTFNSRKDKATKNNCKTCGTIISRKAEYCMKCCNKSDKMKQSFLEKRKLKNRPLKEVLIESVKDIGYVKTGEKYEVSDTTIRKWIKQYDIMM